MLRGIDSEQGILIAGERIRNMRESAFWRPTMLVDTPVDRLARGIGSGGVQSVVD
jgi:hypothetical protein